jgi:hypothetical protein
MTIFSRFINVFGQSKDEEIISFLKSTEKFTQGDLPTIAHCLPKGFESYSIITHPFEIATNLSDSLVTLDEFENRVTYDFEKAKQSEPLGLTITMTDKQGRIIDLTQHSIQKIEWHKKQTWKLADWKEVCYKNGIPFEGHTTLNSIWNHFSKSGIPYNLNYPDEGVLAYDKFKIILEQLRKDSRYNRLYVYQEMPHSITENDTLMLMYIDDILSFFQRSGFKGYLCSVDKSFILYTDSDLQFSLWASNKELNDKLDNVIEMLPARLSYKLND